jgi:hypothetical protein
MGARRIIVGDDFGGRFQHVTLLEASYVLPLRWTNDDGRSGMTSYLQWLSTQLEVIVVDGSPEEVWQRHASEWSAMVKHIRPDADLHYLNGKVNGVTTGVRAAGYERVIVADDDVRYDVASLRRMASLLGTHDLVIGQSYFDPTPWQARWDTARILLNRAFGVHFPATLGVARSLFLEIGGYDGDVLFENLELIRSLEIAGARKAAPGDLFVRHIAATPRAFWSQRIRQAYDDFALPGRMILWLTIGPALARSLARRRLKSVSAAAGAAVVVAELGRRRAGGSRVYPGGASLYAPLWLTERALCAWAALYYRVAKGGIPYRNGVIARAANPPKQLRRRLAAPVEYRHRGP